MRSNLEELTSIDLEILHQISSCLKDKVEILVIETVWSRRNVPCLCNEDEGNACECSCRRIKVWLFMLMFGFESLPLHRAAHVNGSHVVGNEYSRTCAHGSLRMG